MKNKKLLIPCLILIILASISIIIYMLVNKDKDPQEYTIDGIDLVENKEILKDTNVENLKITNVSLLTRNGISSYKAEVENNTEEDINIKKLYVIFYENETKNEIAVLSNTTIKTNNKTYINITFESDYSKTTKIEYRLEKK